MRKPVKFRSKVVALDHEVLIEVIAAPVHVKSSVSTTSNENSKRLGSLVSEKKL